MAEDFNPVIGRKILETLTTGMYDDARFIFREYVQNAADQIDIAVEEKILEEKDNGKITINIDNINKEVTIEDNATGIQSSSVLQFLGDVANSQKDRIKRRGFRGIGRLGGLGYCDKLIFETSYKGEPIQSRMSLDAKLLNKIILDINETSDASTAISVITTIEKIPEETEEHYFKVTLQNVTNDKILDEESVRQYLSMVVPVPFSDNFSFSKNVKQYYEKNNVIFDEYNIMLNGSNIFKAYKNEFLSDDEKRSILVGVDFIDIRNDDQELLAICWYGFRDSSNYVLEPKNYERGIRIRLKNITIGDESTSKRFFNAERTNLRFIGEIHVLSDTFIPNARRDYFDENNTCMIFESRLKEILVQENLENRLAQTSSKLHNRLREIERYRDNLKNFENLKNTFDSAAVETYHLNKLKISKEKAIHASKELEKIQKRSLNDQNISKLFKQVVGDKDIIVVADSTDNLQVSQYNPPTFSKLTDQQSEIVIEIFNLIEENLSFEESEALKKKIIDQYN